MSLVCFDSNFVIWSVKQQATPGQEGNIAKAMIYSADRGLQRFAAPCVQVVGIEEI